MWERGEGSGRGVRGETGKCERGRGKEANDVGNRREERGKDERGMGEGKREDGERGVDWGERKGVRSGEGKRGE